MIRIGLTGSIGMGKSAVSAMFEQMGVPVFDADAEVHRLQGPGGELVQKIEKRFPGSTGPKGVDRAKLGPMVLGKPHELRALEAIVHPAVARNRSKWMKRHRARAMVVLDIPLLFEKSKRGQRLRGVDVTVTVSAPSWMQTKRVLARPNMTPAKLKQVRGLQVPDHQKRHRADYLIETGRLKHQTRAAVKSLIACLKQKKGR